MINFQLLSNLVQKVTSPFSKECTRFGTNTKRRSKYCKQKEIYQNDDIFGGCLCNVLATMAFIQHSSVVME